MSGDDNAEYTAADLHWFRKRAEAFGITEDDVIIFQYSYGGRLRTVTTEKELERAVDWIFLTLGMSGYAYERGKIRQVINEKGVLFGAVIGLFEAGHDIFDMKDSV